MVMAWRPDDKINEYGEPTYWDQHYDKKRKEEGLEYSFDFYVEPESLMPLLESYFGTDKGMNLLIIGAGSSEIPQLLYEAGFRRITCIDVSPVLVAHMQNRHHQHEGLDYFVMDVKNLGSFPDNSFDGILDKGTMDALFGSIRCMDDVLLMSKEVCRVLKVGKTFVEVSHGLPDTRLIYLRHHSLQWTAQHFTLPTNSSVHVYHMTKTPALPALTAGGDAEAAALLGAARARRRAGSLDLGVVRDLGETLADVRAMAAEYAAADADPDA